GRLLAPLPLLLACQFNALIDGLAAGEPFFGRMPVGDFLFAKFPAEQENFSFDLAGKIQQSDIDVLDLHSGGVNFSDRIFGALEGESRWERYCQVSGVRRQARFLVITAHGLVDFGVGASAQKGLLPCPKKRKAPSM